MEQLTKRNTQASGKKKKKTLRPKRKHKQLYGTSRLEEDFASDFLDKLGVEYEYQYEAKDIGRFYDFKVKDGPIIEIQGSYWHGDARIYEEKDLNQIQRKNMRIDEYKQKWALMHGIPIYYIWEKDIRENPKMVMDELKRILYIEDKKKETATNKRKRHVNKIK